MSNDLIKRDGGKGDAFSKIMRFYQKGDVVLSSDEEKILDRWIYGNLLIKSKKYREEEIIERIVDKWGVSRFTAQRDLNFIEALFAAARVHSKEYLLHHHIEDIRMSIRQFETNSKLQPLLPKMYDALTKAIEALPDAMDVSKIPAPIIIINVVQGQNIAAPMSAEDAMVQADELIEFERSHQYIEFEEVKP